MKPARYTVPDRAPPWVKTILTGSPSRRSLQLLVILSLGAGLAVAYAERGKPGAWAASVFFIYAALAWRGLRWGEQNGLLTTRENVSR